MSQCVLQHLVPIIALPGLASLITGQYELFLIMLCNVNYF